MKFLYLLFLSGFLILPAVHAQQKGGLLEIELDKNILQPGDSLLVNINYTDSNYLLVDQPMATLELIIENEHGQRTRLRWPMIDNQASGILHLPDSLHHGKYSLLAGLQQRSFEVIGKIQNASVAGFRNQPIIAMLLTNKGHWDEQEVPVHSDGSFVIRNWLFADNALLAFSATDKLKRPLDIRISTRLDSANSPIAVAGKSFYIGNPPDNLPKNFDEKPEVKETDFTKKGDLLPAVLVRTTMKSRAQQFNEEYTRGLFRSDNERMISIMDDPTAIASRDILWYLQGRVAGLQIMTAGLNSSAIWRGNPVSFFLDEMIVSSQVLSTIPVADIAIVKIFPPPFMGAPGGGSGGGIAVYTRRGGEASFLPENRQVFKVRGYTREAVLLEMDKMLL